jgi:hypothetical protein
LNLLAISKTLLLDIIVSKLAVSRRNFTLSVLIHDRYTFGERLHNTAADLGFLVVTFGMQSIQSDVCAGGISP